MTTLKKLLVGNPLFDVLATSSIRPDLSYRNSNQHCDFRCKFCHAVYSNHVADAFAPTIRKHMSKPSNLFSCTNCGRRWDPESSKGVTRSAEQSRGMNISALVYPNRKFDRVELELYEFEETLD